MSKDKTRKYIESTQTLIRTQREEYIRAATGEIIEFEQITKVVHGRQNFWKVYLMDFLSVLGIVDSRQLDVLIYIAENTRQGDNMFIGTYDKICADIGVSRRTVARIMIKLQDNNFIKRVQNGVWLINPSILMKGKENKKQILLNYYNAENPVDKISTSKTKKLKAIYPDDYPPVQDGEQLTIDYYPELKPLSEDREGAENGQNTD
jgi:hypothetical protein